MENSSQFMWVKTGTYSAILHLLGPQISATELFSEKLLQKSDSISAVKDFYLPKFCLRSSKKLWLANLMYRSKKTRRRQQRETRQFHWKFWKRKRTLYVLYVLLTIFCLYIYLSHFQLPLIISWPRQLLYSPRFSFPGMTLSE